MKQLNIYLKLSGSTLRTVEVNSPRSRADFTFVLADQFSDFRLLAEWSVVLTLPFPQGQGYFRPRW